MESAKVLETYLDRAQEDWRDFVRPAGAAGGERASAGGDAFGNGGPGGMTKEESYKILGLEPGASAEEIKAAYHRLMAALHPDKGGSTYLATKLNEAKDQLL
jgi:DnaJ-domain-containing protein 1